jgi:hypothetical protein
MAYLMDSGAQQDVVVLLFEVDENRIVTVQPSTGAKEISEFAIDEGGVLRVKFAGVESRFRKVAGP